MSKENSDEFQNSLQHHLPSPSFTSQLVTVKLSDYVTIKACVTAPAEGHTAEHPKKNNPQTETNKKYPNSNTNLTFLHCR
jgi:hypothetical protein